jgi:hypothetical protein
MTTSIAAILREAADKIEKAVATDPVRDVYGKPLEELKAPEGYEFTGEFRAPREGEPVLHVISAMHPRLHVALHDWDDDDPRLILRRRTSRRWVFEETGETRRVEPGEWWLRCEDDFQVWITMSHQTTFVEYPILRLVDKPEKDSQR